MLDLETPYGRARARLLRVDRPSGALVLGHGAGGSIDSPDLLAAAEAAAEAAFTTALVEQPYRVAGRRNQPPVSQLDAVWLAVISQLRVGGLQDLPLVVGGRSAGARVACRTAAEAGAVAVLCLAFPLHPPGRGDDPTKSRLPELEALRVPVLVVQGDRDPFGIPPEGPHRKVLQIRGNHSLRDTDAVKEAVAVWLGSLL